MWHKRVTKESGPNIANQAARVMRGVPSRGSPRSFIAAAESHKRTRVQRGRAIPECNEVRRLSEMPEDVRVPMSAAIARDLKRARDASVNGNDYVLPARAGGHR
jgi:hypothetical protein